MLYCAIGLLTILIARCTEAMHLNFEGYLGTKNQKDFVDGLIDNGKIRSIEVVKALLLVNRMKYKSNPYEAIDLNRGVASSFPNTHALILETLKDYLKEGSKALDVQCGGGYMTTCMAMMVGKTGYAVGTDSSFNAVQCAVKNTLKENPDLLNSGRVRFVNSKMHQGVFEFAPYDAIHIGSEENGLILDGANMLYQFIVGKNEGKNEGIVLLAELVEQLKCGGRMVTPVNTEDEGPELMIIDKDMKGKLTVSTVNTKENSLRPGEVYAQEPVMHEVDEENIEWSFGQF